MFLLPQIFGPVQSIIKYSNVADAIKEANNTSYGLAAAVFTKDIDSYTAIADELQAGTVWYVLAVETERENTLVCADLPRLESYL